MSDAAPAAGAHRRPATRALTAAGYTELRQLAGSAVEPVHYTESGRGHSNKCSRR